MYHSALTKDLPVDKELDYFTDNGNIVFVNDITKNIDIYKWPHIDIIYSEPAWKLGYEKYRKRANAEMSTYEEYLASIKNLIKTLQKPTILVTGKHALKTLEPDGYINIKLNGGEALAMFWSIGMMSIVNTTEELIHELAQQYKCVLDFSAGYGNTAMIFKQHGKKFVCSDVNGKCVYVIAKTLMNYKEDK